jgi:4-oxalocrotonate tautomerase
MPLVKIDLPDSYTLQQAQAAGNAVHEALVETMGVPHDDRFQLLTRRPPGTFVCTPEYLGVRHDPARVVLVQVLLAPTRSLQQKRAFYKQTAATVAAACGVSPSDVLIGLTETHRENWSFGDGVAHYTL